MNRWNSGGASAGMLDGQAAVTTGTLTEEGTTGVLAARREDRLHDWILNEYLPIFPMIICSGSVNCITTGPRYQSVFIHENERRMK